MLPLLVLILSKVSQIASDEAEGRQMFGLDTGNPAADQEAEMWIAALLGECSYHITLYVNLCMLNHGLSRNIGCCHSCCTSQSKLRI